MRSWANHSPNPPPLSTTFNTSTFGGHKPQHCICQRPRRLLQDRHPSLSLLESPCALSLPHGLLWALREALGTAGPIPQPSLFLCRHPQTRHYFISSTSYLLLKGMILPKALSKKICSESLRKRKRLGVPSSSKHHLAVQVLVEKIYHEGGARREQGVSAGEVP